MRISYYSLKQFIWNLVVNGIIMSYIFSPSLRLFFLNMIGCKLMSDSGGLQGHCMLLSNKLILGRGSYINRECLIDNASGKIIIGNNVSIGCRCCIHTTNHDYSNPLKRGGKVKGESVVIKDGCWLGSNVIILPGAVINEGVVIASGSIVKGELDANSLYAGIPARKIKDIK